MNEAQKIIFEETMRTIAGYYAQLIKQEGLTVTQETLSKAVGNNWDNISANIANIYAESCVTLGV